MWTRLLVDLALPPWVRVLLPYALVAVGAVGAWLWFAGHYYDQGYAARESELQVAASAYRERIAGINAANTATGAKADAEIKRLRGIVAAQRNQLREDLTNEPDYAAVRRPDRVHAHRVRDLDAIARAAADRELRD